MKIKVNLKKFKVKLSMKSRVVEDGESFKILKELIIFFFFIIILE